MTTPQNVLYDIRDNLNRLAAKFEIQSDDEDYFDITEIKKELSETNKRLDNIEAIMVLIVKSLSETKGQ